MWHPCVILEDDYIIYMNEQENLNNIFSQFKIAVNCTNFTKYKNSLCYDLKLAPRTRIQHIEKYLTEISLALKAPSNPTLQILAKEGVLRLEYILPNPEKIDLFTFGQNTIKPEGKIQCLLGEDFRGEPIWLDIGYAPHVLIAGTTGSGKSTLLHTIIANLLTMNVSIDLIDPKNIEFCNYNNKFNRVNVSFDYNGALNTIKFLCEEMEARYAVLRAGYKLEDYFPYRVLIIDEFADLILQDNNKELFTYLCLLIQKSRAAGIHLILSTQRPSVNILEGTIKANVPVRIACKVSSAIDSRVILGEKGAEHLLGNGDAIINGLNYTMQRFQAAYTNAAKVGIYFGGSNMK